ncbi:hypothetical protein VSS82_02720 [Lactobacillus delbrueckii subsp. allosunkii]
MCLLQWTFLRRGLPNFTQIKDQRRSA